MVDDFDDSIKFCLSFSKIIKILCNNITIDSRKLMLDNYFEYKLYLKFDFTLNL